MWPSSVWIEGLYSYPLGDRCGYEYTLENTTKTTLLETFSFDTIIKQSGSLVLLKRSISTPLNTDPVSLANSWISTSDSYSILMGCVFNSWKAIRMCDHCTTVSNSRWKVNPLNTYPGQLLGGFVLFIYYITLCDDQSEKKIIMAQKRDFRSFSCWNVEAKHHSHYSVIARMWRNVLTLQLCCQI